MTKEPSEEVKAIIKYWVELQKDKYGDNWKEILSKEMSPDLEIFYKQLLKRLEK